MSRNISKFIMFGKWLKIWRNWQEKKNVIMLSGKDINEKREILDYTY